MDKWLVKDPKGDKPIVNLHNYVPPAPARPPVPKKRGRPRLPSPPPMTVEEKDELIAHALSLEQELAAEEAVGLREKKSEQTTACFGPH